MIKCWLFGHKPLLLKVLNKKAFIQINDYYYEVNNIITNSPLIDIHMCERCKYVYWIPAI